MNRELGELQHIEQRRMLSSFSGEGCNRAIAEFAGSSILAESVFRAPPLIIFAIGAVATAVLEYARHRRGPSS